MSKHKNYLHNPGILINKKWPVEIEGYEEQRDILQSILKERLSYEYEKFKNYAIDTIAILKKRALEAKKNADNPKGNLKDYVQGVIMGYYSIISLLKHQSFTFCIDQKELGLADIKPDVDLLGLHKNPNIESEEDNWAIDDLSEEKIKGYLSDTIVLLKKQAIEVKEEAYNPKAGSEDYSKGELMAYCCTISILQEQTQDFKVDLVEIGLDDVNSELFMPLKDKN